MKVIYRSVVADSIIEAIDLAISEGWPIEHIELTKKEWFGFNNYLMHLNWPALPENTEGGILMFHGVKIIMEG